MPKKTWVTVALVVVVALGLYVSIRQFGKKNALTKYTNSFFDTFDTIVTVVAYTPSEQQFDDYFRQIHDRLLELHQYYDIYHEYPGINNLKTVNDRAGVEPVPVAKEIIDLVGFSKEWYAKTSRKTNIALGAVLKIWHDYRTRGIDDPDAAELPPIASLLSAGEHVDIDKVIVDAESGTVYLEDPEMSLDVGSVAKGYATELVAEEMKAKGFVSAIISSGGNARTIGKPLDGVRERWGIGIQDPAKSIFSDEENLLDVVYANDMSIVTSGDYQRYYVVDDKIVHHLIDPATLMPADYFHSVTVVTPDSGAADFLSTTLFLMPYEESRALAESLDGVDALWVLFDGTVEMTDGLKAIAASGGASGALPAK